MTAVEQIVVVAVVLGALIALWIVLKRVAGGESPQLIEEPHEDLMRIEEQHEVLEGAAVLLADESLTIQKVVELAFMDTSARLVCAADGKSAMDLLSKEDIDVVITDVHIPAVNGYEVCEYSKKLNPETPVLLLVATFEPFSKDLYRKCGADEVLKKPFDSADLIRIISTLLQRQRGDRQ